MKRQAPVDGLLELEIRGMIGTCISLLLATDNTDFSEWQPHSVPRDAAVLAGGVTICHLNIIWHII